MFSDVLSNLPWKKKPLCSLAGVCSGCEWIHIPRSKQLQEKERLFREIWQNTTDIALPTQMNILDTGEKKLRIQCDLSFRRDGDTCVLGLYDIDRENIVALNACPIVTDDVEEFIQDLAKHPPPIPRASIRLRVNPHGLRGMWIDAANEDIRILLNEKRWLQHWLRDCHVEIGQKRKYVAQSHGELSLELPLLRMWFHSYFPDENQDIPLWTVVGGFTQPSILSNRHLVTRVLNIAEQIPAKTWLEFGAGCGNFTIPFAKKFAKIIATETSTLSVQGLDKSIAHHKLQQHVQISPLNLERKTPESVELLQQCDAMLVDPPRSGLRHALENIRLAPPPNILYVSCHGQSLATDASILRDIGYTLEHIEGVDQFPHTAHCEWISHWKLSERKV